MLASLVFLAATAPGPLTTVAERSQFLRTGRYDEVKELCAGFEKRYPQKVRCFRFGETPEGRPMLALSASADGTLTPAAARKKGRPVLLVQGGIHAGEIDGKDAGFWALRELLDGKAPGLDRVTWLFVPVFNVDGHERFGAHNRPNQTGPEEMGFRVTSRGLNLNRDYMKADAPEMQAMLRLFGEWDPILTADLHVTDGAQFEPDVAVLLEPANAGPLPMRAVGKRVQDVLLHDLEAAGHQPLPFYPSFVKDDDPLSGFAAGIALPRMSTGYVPLRNRFVMLVETHSWKDYRTRVKATCDTILGLTTLAAKEGGAWLEAARAADEAAQRAGGTELPLAYERGDHTVPLRFRGFAFEHAASEPLGGTVIRYDLSKPTIWEIPYYDEVRPVALTKLPRGGYLVPAAHASWVAEKLQLHAITFTRLPAALREHAVEVFRAREVQWAPASYEGRHAATVKGAWSAETHDVPAGALYVPIAQPRSALVAHLFEPVAPDSFVSWGFFNVAFERREYMEDYVADEVGRRMLEDPAIKAEFETRLAKDPDFAKSREARHEFFYSRHPSWDDRYRLYPVYRVDVAPPQ